MTITRAILDGLRQGAIEFFEPIVWFYQTSKRQFKGSKWYWKAAIALSRAVMTVLILWALTFFFTLSYLAVFLLLHWMFP